MDVTTLPAEDFESTNHVIGGKEVIFIRPKPTFQGWTIDNLCYRSSIWTKDGNLVSGSFKKFFNLEERPDIDPFPKQFSNISVMEKIDGSTLIVSKIGFTTICRTRGTVDAYTQPNGHELKFLCSKYVEFFSWLESTDNIDYSFLFEWVSPSNKIIIDYGKEPDLYLTNIVRHKDYSFWKQEDVSKFAIDFKLKRPESYHYKTLQELIQDVSVWEGKEGVCVYYNEDQCIRKVKSAHYLKLHSFKSNLTLKNICKLFFDSNYTSEYSFLSYLTSVFDYECSKAAEPYVKDLFILLSELEEEEKRILSFIEVTKDLDQKEFALKVKESLPASLSGLAFTLRKSEQLPKELKFKRTVNRIKQDAKHYYTLKEE